MPDRDKVMKGLEHCGTVNKPLLGLLPCDGCPYDTDEHCQRKLHDDALALPKEQEPRVLEYSEIEGCPLVWLEDIDKEDVLPALDLEHSGEDVLFVRKATDPYYGSLFHCETFYAYEEDYGTRWRAWTARPTEKQRKAVKWDET